MLEDYIACICVSKQSMSHAIIHIETLDLGAKYQILIK